jgi:hypothetical protein
MMELGIAHLGLSEPDSYRLRTVSSFAATVAVLRHRWVMSVPEKADLLVVNSDWPPPRIRSSANGMRQIVAVLAKDSDEVPGGYLRLRSPIRLENLLSLLTAVEGSAERIWRERLTRAGAGVSEDMLSPLLELAALIREETIRREGDGAEPSGALWSASGFTEQPLIICPGERAFYSDEPLISPSLEKDVPIEIVPVAEHEAGPLSGKRPLVMLQWAVGLYSGRNGLLPWIGLERPIRLTRYPPFTALWHAPAHRRIAAALSRPRNDLQAICQVARSDVRTVTGFINAASLCGFLRSAPPDPAPARTGRPVVRRSLLQSFRRALGIKTDGD